MGAQFVELDDESRRILQEMANGYELQADDSSREEQAEEDAEAPLAEEETTAPVELVDPATRERPAPTGPVTTAARPPTVARAQQASPAPSWRIWVLSAAGLGAALGAGLWLGSATNEPAIPVAEMPRSEAPPEPEPAEPTAPVVAEPDETDLVHEWARAWSEQRVDDYLATYSARFEPPRGLHRTAWEERRRQRLLAPQRIQVTLASIEVEKLSDDSSRVRFVQEYESDKYHDVVRKILDLELVEGGWKILRESTE
jgi:hypothetical protein